MDVMDSARTLWATGLDWANPPLRVSLFAAIVAVAGLKGVPLLLRAAGWMTSTGASPTVDLLVYPEYRITTVCRSRGWPLLPGTFAYGTALGRLESALRQTGQRLSAVGQRRRRVPRALLIGSSALLLVGWFIPAEHVPTDLAQPLVLFNAHVADLDGWIATGFWPA